MAGTMVMLWSKILSAQTADLQLSQPVGVRALELHQGGRLFLNVPALSVDHSLHLADLHDSPPGFELPRDPNDELVSCSNDAVRNKTGAFSCPHAHHHRGYTLH